MSSFPFLWTLKQCFLSRYPSGNLLGSWRRFGRHFWRNSYGWIWSCTVFPFRGCYLSHGLNCQRLYSSLHFPNKGRGEVKSVLWKTQWNTLTSLISSFTTDSKRVPVKVGRIRPDAILSGLKFKKNTWRKWRSLSPNYIQASVISALKSGFSFEKSALIDCCLKDFICCIIVTFIWLIICQLNFTFLKFCPF